MGALNRIVSFSRIYNKVPNLSETKIILKDLLSLSENKVTIDFIQTVNELGVPLTDDFNGAAQTGVGFYQFMNCKGKRSSAAYAFIEPEKDNPKLKYILIHKLKK